LLAVTSKDMHGTAAVSTRERKCSNLQSTERGDAAYGLPFRLVGCT